MKREAVSAWLAARRPERPASLEASIGRALAACPDSELAAAANMAEAMARLGLATLSAVTERGQEEAVRALKLLAADAFVTYAFEAAAEDGLSVEPLVEQVLRGAEAAR